MSNNQTLKKITATIQQVYSVFVIIFCIKNILPAFFNGTKYSGVGDYFLFAFNILLAAINIALFILGERISKTKTTSDTSAYSKQAEVKKQILIIVLNCVFFLFIFATLLVTLLHYPSFLLCFLFLLAISPLLAIVILTSVSLKLELKSENGMEENRVETSI